MVRTLGFHPEGPGSIPHTGDFFLNFNSDTYFQSSANSLSAAYYSFQHSVLSMIAVQLKNQELIGLILVITKKN